MQFAELLRARRSVRSFVARPVEAAALTAILEAANSAPSAGNLQAYAIFVVKGARRRAQLAAAAFGESAITEAPVVLAFCADPARSAARYGSRGSELYCIQDAAIAATFAWLAAVDRGLAAVWIGALNERAVAKVLSTQLRPVVLLPIGWAAERPHPTPRRPLRELIHEV